MPDPEPLADLEAAYLAARDARDRLDVARARGLPPDASVLERDAEAAEAAVRGLLAAIDAAPSTALSPDDSRALGAMRAGIETAFGPDAEPPVAPRGRACLVRRRLGVGRGHRGRRNDPAGAPRGLLRDARG